MSKEAIFISDEVLQFYKNHTAKETLQRFNMPTDGRHIKALFRHYPKNLGWGGSRKGSGNKKGFNGLKKN